MIKQVFSIKNYWEVVVFYNIESSNFEKVYSSLVYAGASDKMIDEIYTMLSSGQAKAVTYNNLSMHQSVVIFNPHNSRIDYIDSIVHEAEHVKQGILEAYSVEDSGEAPAYTIGFIIGLMYHGFADIMCSCA